MICSSNEKGEGILILSPEEKIAFEKGEKITHTSGDRLGVFTISVKLTRPNRRDKRFPVESYVENYKPEKNPVSASVQIQEERRNYMRKESDRMLAEFDFSPDTFEGSDGWEWDTGKPDIAVCTIYLLGEDEDRSVPCEFEVDFSGEQPVARLF